MIPRPDRREPLRSRESADHPSKVSRWMRPRIAEEKASRFADPRFAGHPEIRDCGACWIEACDAPRWPLRSRPAAVRMTATRRLPRSSCPARPERRTFQSRSLQPPPNPHRREKALRAPCSSHRQPRLPLPRHYYSIAHSVFKIRRSESSGGLKTASPATPTARLKMVRTLAFFLTTWRTDGWETSTISRLRIPWNRLIM